MKKRLKITLIVVLIPTLALFTTNALVNRSIKTEIIIDASAENVWQVLMNHETYPEWNPFITQISGSTVKGDELDVYIQGTGNSPMNFKPIVLVNKENTEFRWKGKMGIKGIFDGEHFFTLHQISANQTRFTQGEIFTGLLSGVLIKLIGKDTKAGFVSMNEALKLRTEEN